MKILIIIIILLIIYYYKLIKLIKKLTSNVKSYD